MIFGLFRQLLKPLLTALVLCVTTINMAMGDERPTIILYRIRNAGVSGLGPINYITTYANAQITLPANTFTKDNYVFKCWCVASDRSCSDCSSTYSATSCVYTDQQSITTSDQDMYLCAQWDPQGAIITFNKNSTEATGTMGPMLHLEAGTHRLNMNTYSRPNYQFKCWATSISGDCVYDDGAEITVTENQEINLYAKWARNGVITVRTPVTGIDDINLYTIFNDGVFLDEDRTLRMATDANPMTIPTIPAESVRYVDVNGNIHDNFENAIISLHSQDMQVQELMGYSGLDYSDHERPLVIDERGYITEKGLTIGKSLDFNVYWDGVLVRASLPVSSLWTPESKSGYAFDGWYAGNFKYNSNDVISLTKLVVPGETNFNAGKIERSVIFAQWDGNKINLNWLAGDGHNSAKTDVPSEYTVLDYIESDGQQVIDTGVTGNAKWEITAQATEYTTTPDASAKVANVLVARGETSLNWFGSLLDVAWSVNNSLFDPTVGDWDLNGAALANWGAIKTGFLNGLKQRSEFSSVGVPADQKSNIIVNFASDYIAGMVNERSFHDMIIEEQGPLRSIARSVPSYHLFGYTSEDNFFKGKLYSAKAIQDGRLVFNGIPVKRNADGVETVGLYDTVSGQFFGNSGGGSFVAGDAVNIKAPDFCIYGTKFTMPAALVDSGYTFTGWKVNGTNITKGADTVEVSCDYDTLGVYDGSATITAQWTPNTYTITLDDGDICTATPQDCTSDLYEQYATGWFGDASATIPIDQDAERAGVQISVPIFDSYIFRGYYTTELPAVTSNTASGAPEIARDTPYTDTATSAEATAHVTLPAADRYVADTTLYAAWAYFCNPGIHAHCSLSIDTNGYVTYTTSCDEGYTLVTGTDGTYSPQCTANTFDVYFDKNGGTGGTDAIKEEYGVRWTNADAEPATILAVPELPTKTGNVFTGYWENDTLRIPANGSLVDSATLTTTTFTADTTLTAGWTNCKPDGYLDTIGAADKHISGISVTVSDNQCVYTVTCAEGYDASGTVTTNTTAIANDFVDICSDGVVSTYTVTFNAEDATGSKDDVVCAVETDCDITNKTNEITKSDYEFLGWTDIQGSKTPKYKVTATSEGKIYINKNDTNDVELFAVWNPVCLSNKYLRIGTDVTDKICLYENRHDTSRPALAIRLATDSGLKTYYIDMSDAESNKTINGQSLKKLHIMYNNKQYNVYDLTALE